MSEEKAVKSEHELFETWWNESGRTIADNVRWRASHEKDMASSAFIAGMRKIAIDSTPEPPLQEGEQVKGKYSLEEPYRYSFDDTGPIEFYEWRTYLCENGRRTETVIAAPTNEELCKRAQTIIDALNRSAELAIIRTQNLTNWQSNFAPNSPRNKKRLKG